MSRYRLSKASGIPWAALSDIYSGKIRLNRCGAGILSKLSKVLGLSIEGLLALETEPKRSAVSGKPDRKTYLESGLPASVQKAIKEIWTENRRDCSECGETVGTKKSGRLNIRHKKG